MTVTPLEWVLGHDMITMHKDSRELVWTWDNCQRYAHISWLPLESLTHLVTISDNGPQFDSFNYRKFCAELGIKNLYSSPCYPQANGQAKTMIKSLLDTLKKRLQRVDEPWVEELPKVLWVYQNHAMTSNWEDSFLLSLWYGSCHPN
ncbi:hypothetical protein CK203_034713 [Vitis vinifera]|uniref:Integrase catalytic domain-containing protein n=1 Tax=Vitis vinifera TaxID=29760 RepID=A0A438HWK3_VITVI|nr:hypothetical protein CK203_034713 [Vitis vinifera]